MFDKFWKAYPRKTDKGKAFTSWKKVCDLPGTQRPILKVVLDAIKSHKKSKRWQNPKYIAMPSTWLNQHRWLDTAETLPIITKDKIKQSHGTEGRGSYSPEVKEREI